MKNRKKHIHFVGIGGIGVSSLARYFLSEGHDVSGSDVNPCEELKKIDMEIFPGHSEKNISEDIDLLIYSTAVSQENKEIKRARDIGVKIQSYPEILGEVAKEYYTVAVSGTHGKSTTTAMLSLVMENAGLDPTVIIGTKLKEFGNTNFRKGESKYLLIEADEFGAAFLNYYPQIAVVTNIEEDHLDFYRDIEDILLTFKNYVANNLQKGILIVNKDDKNSHDLKSVAAGKVIEYTLKQKEAKKIKLSVPGKHNISNALAVFSVAKEIGIKERVILEGLSNFKGTWRRFDEREIILKNNSRVKIIHDYAHHPTEIKATVEAIREKYPANTLYLVFQPHQYERTHRLFSQFVEVLSSVDVNKLIIPDIYTVKGRESKEIMEKVSSVFLSEKIKGSIYGGNLESTGKYLMENLQGNEIVAIMGAGDVYDLEGYIKRS